MSFDKNIGTSERAASAGEAALPLQHTLPDLYKTGSIVVGMFGKKTPRYPHV